MDNILDAMMAGDITLITVILWYIVALVLGAVGGAIGGMLVGGEHMGNELAAMMGAFFGPIAAAPGVLLALIVLLFI